MENYNVYNIFSNNKTDMEIHLRSKNLNTAVIEFELASNSIHFSQVLNESSLNHYLRTANFPLNLLNLSTLAYFNSCKHLSTTYIKSIRDLRMLNVLHPNEMKTIKSKSRHAFTLHKSFNSKLTLKLPNVSETLIK